MSADTRLEVVLCWHMHQPDYRDRISGQYHLPWVYLHAIKDYVDMAAHLEAVAPARAVVNFAPILLEQIADYANQVQGFIANGSAIRDPLLAALAHAPLPGDPEQRLTLIKACLRANEKRMIDRFPAYRRLVDVAQLVLTQPAILAYLEEQFLADLVTWYHLAWLGETVRREDPRVRRLLEREHRFGLHDRRELLEVIGDLLAGIIPRYARLAESGRVELSLTPYAHPILPLLVDFEAARESIPDAPLPQHSGYPGGEARARWHIEEGIATFRRHFGFVPLGCWPSEGGVSEAGLRLLEEAGFRWAASGGAVLHHSLAKGQMDVGCVHRSWRVRDANLHCFFRDDGLSDLIGFTYADWHAEDAVANLLHHLENIANACNGTAQPLVAIILDGENAWEHYPENGYHFLRALYERLSAHPRIALTTFGEALAAPREAPSLPQLVAGSWVYGTFSTWIGETDKNRGWDMLADAKQAYDSVVAAGRLPSERLVLAQHQLAVCEGSDWFWWFGDYNPTDAVHDFDHLFRLQLANLYQLIHVEPPQYLARAFTHGGGRPMRGGTMRQGQLSA